MTRMIKVFQRYIVLAVLMLMMIAVFAATIEFGVILAQQLLKPPFLLNLPELLEVFGFFLIVLIGLKLLETIRACLTQEKMLVKAGFLVAMMAIVRRVIILDIGEMTVGMLAGIAAMMIALSAGYFLLDRTLNGPRNGTLRPSSHNG